MSVLIRGMEMPSNCYTCLFMYHGMRSEQVWCTAIENRWLDLRETLCEERHKDCPLIPAADVREVKRGTWGHRWISNMSGYEYACSCSVCGKPTYRVSTLEEMPPYCPNCGAKMEVEE